jgi:hypothetical protein
MGPPSKRRPMLQLRSSSVNYCFVHDVMAGKTVHDVMAVIR